MTRTTAVGSAESPWPAFSTATQNVRPRTFLFAIVRTPPTIEQAPHFEQVVDMPMADVGAATTLVASEAGSKSTRATSAPNVQVIPGFKGLPPEPARGKDDRFGQLDIEQI